jgi:hypothetical protein
MTFGLTVCEVVMLVIGSVFSQIFRSVIGDMNWNPSAIFYGGEPGVWYDPSDITTLFQDNLGATPVTAAGQTVGRILDKSGRGNHATQATLAQRPTYGINPITGTRNLLTRTEQFDNAAWGKTGTSISADAATAPDGTTTADLLSQTVVSLEHYAEQTGLQTTAGAYTASYYVKAGTVSSFQIMVVHSGQSPTTSTGTFNISDGVITYFTGSGIVSGGSATSVGGGWYRCSISYTLSGSVTSHRTRIYAGLSGVFLGNAANNLLVWGAQVEQSATATAYQKVVSQYEVTQAGVASAFYLAFDGVDDGMVTATITPAIDEVQVFAGLRKLSDSAQKIVAEMSATIASNNGAFALTAPNSAAANYNFSTKGTTQTDNVVTTYTAPITSVISGLGDIAGASNLIRVNGSQVGSVLTTQGTGNYLAYPLYIGRRGGSTLPLSGRIYSLIMRFGPNLAANQIVSAETWVNEKTGAY